MREDSTELSGPVLYKPDTKYPVRFAAISLIFLYFFQYPLSRLVDIYTVPQQYSMKDWGVAYVFVIVSAVVLIGSLYVGLCGSMTRVEAISRRNSKPRKVGLPLVLFIFAVFFLWSYLMLKLKIGMTIYADFDPLPFKVTGLLFYGRLFIQPLVLFYIARAYVGSKLKLLLLLLMVALGSWAALTSGSRFVAIMFSLPVLFLFAGRRKYVAFAIAVLSYITIATLSRNFYLPFEIGGELLDIYANAAYQEAVTENILLLPISYVVARVMGMAEVLLTLNFGEISPTSIDAVLSFLSYFFPFMPHGKGVSIKTVYGVGDDAFGGYGLDLFSNYWVFFGGDLIVYGVGLILIGWMLGKTQRLFTVALARFGLSDASMFIFVLLFILVFEGRAFLLPSLLLTAWLLSRKSTCRFVLSRLKSSSRRQIRLAQ
jgi:hypothetical protein